MDEADLTSRDAAEYCVAMSEEFAAILRREGADGLPLALALEHLRDVAALYLRPQRTRQAPLAKPAPDETA